MSTQALFAEVVVHSPLGRAAEPSARRREKATASGANLRQIFHYSVPSHLCDSVLVGQLIWVPFGPRQVPGLILSLSDSSPVVQTRDILDIIDPLPVVTVYQIALMDWISQYYHAPLHLVAWAMFPAAMSWRGEMLLHLAQPSTPTTLRGSQANQPDGTEERRVLEALGDRSPIPLLQLERQLKLKGFRVVIERLVRRGWLRKEWRVRGPQVKPKTEPIAHLLRVPNEDDLAALGRARQQRAVLSYLRDRAHSPGGTEMLEIPVKELCEGTGATRAVVDRLAERGWLRLEEREVRRDPLAGREFVTTVPPKFTPDQELAWQPISQGLEGTRSQVFLLRGVTGSGKTEVYLRALAEVLDQGGQGIVLVPEIALTPQTIRRFAARFPQRLAVLHSRLSAGERYDEWRRIRGGQADVVIGPRSALFSPLPRLRLIVVDEEHEWSYKQQETPCYHARDVAVKLAELTGAVVILGSATPDVASYYRAERREYRLLTLPQRIMAHHGSVEEQEREFRIRTEQARVKALGPGYDDALYMDLPPVQVVDLRVELRTGNRSIFSRALQGAMHVALAAGEQVILFLNRRGTATVVMCRDCGHVLKCRGCDTALTYHGETGKLLCHYCNYERSVPTTCPECGSERIRFFGIGTQKVQEVVRELFPQARTLRWDRDVTGGKDAHERILDQFVRHEADVLIGTQMIAKGLDLPLVTLVGVVTADTVLHLPDFNANERTFQLLAQVAGRAGRSILGGKVVIQTYAPQHFCIQAASRHDYEGFYRQELEFRKKHNYPPFSQLVRLLFVHRNAKTCQEEAERLWDVLHGRVARMGIMDVDLIGPVPCYLGRVRGSYRWQIIVRGSGPTRLLEDLALPVGWQIDVDPISLL